MAYGLVCLLFVLWVGGIVCLRYGAVSSVGLDVCWGAGGGSV